MSSSRLPGKVLMPIGKLNSLEHMIHRLRTVTKIQEICIATTTNTEDDVICQLASTNNVQFYRGSEENVLSRVLEAAQNFEAETIVEVTGDCPFVDTEIVEQFISIYEGNNLDYVSNNIECTYPDGMDVQVFSTEVLRKSSIVATSEKEQEHVTMEIRLSSGKYKKINIVAPLSIRHPEIAITLDTLEDLTLLNAIQNEFGENLLFRCEDIIGLLKSKPYLLELNKDVPRKGYN